MINLLSPEAIRQLRTRYRQRVMVTAGFLLFASLVVCLVNTASLWWLLHATRSSLAQTLATKQSGSATADFKQLEQAATLTARRAAQLANQPGGPAADTLLAKIISHRNPQIKLATFNYNQLAGGGSTLVLTGQAATRQSLLDFIAQLQSDNTFSAVDSPVSNLIKDRDVDFVITLHAK